MANQTIPLDELPPCKRGISRRGFCAAAGSGLVVLGAAACTGDPRLFEGSLDNPTGPSPPVFNDAGQPLDLAGQHASTDLAGQTGSTDLGHSTESCSGKLDAGAASAIAVGSAKHFSANAYDLYVCRDAGGYFTVDAQCTHAGCDLNLTSGHWHCPCHGATFKFDGTSPTSPAHTPLNNYAVCIDAGGNLQVDYTTVVSSTTRS
jgi:Rieske Fe-S protein